MKLNDKYAHRRFIGLCPTCKQEFCTEKIDKIIEDIILERKRSLLLVEDMHRATKQLHECVDSLECLFEAVSPLMDKSNRVFDPLLVDHAFKHAKTILKKWR